MNKKSYTELNNLYTVQEIQCGFDAIWIIKFSMDGKYMATGGRDGILRIWTITEGNETSKITILIICCR